MKKINSILFVSLVAMAGLSACGGGSGGSNGTGTSSTVVTGQFIDSPVSGVSYSTASQSGVTNTNGEYAFVAGETVTFSIGNLSFPATPATPVVTPITIAGAADVTDQTATNIVRLLISLDADGNPDNGIGISDLATQAAVPVDFNVSPTAFASNTDVINLVANSGSSTTTLATVAAAKTHMNATMTQLNNNILGLWSNSSETFVALPNGYFSYEQIGSSENYVQSGTYLYGPIQGSLTLNVTTDLIITPQGDTYGNELGTFNHSISLSGSNMNIDNGLILMSRVDGGNTGIYGTWESGNNVVILMNSGEFLYSEAGAGYEIGTYVVNGANIVFTIIDDYNTTGGMGTGVVTNTFALSVDQNTLTLNATDFTRKIP